MHGPVQMADIVRVRESSADPDNNLVKGGVNVDDWIIGSVFKGFDNDTCVPAADAKKQTF